MFSGAVGVLPLIVNMPWERTRISIGGSGWVVRRSEVNRLTSDMRNASRGLNWIFSGGWEARRWVDSGEEVDRPAMVMVDEAGRWVARLEAIAEPAEGRCEGGRW